MHYPAVIASIDAIFNLTGLVIRAGLYAVLGQMAGHSEVVATLLAGIFVGDALASVAHISWHRAGHTAATIAELLLLLVLFIWLGSDLTWPHMFAASSLHCWAVAVGVATLRLRGRRAISPHSQAPTGASLKNGPRPMHGSANWPNTR